jgi:hypothetical protein
VGGAASVVPFGATASTARREDEEVVEGDEHRGVKAERGESLSGLGGGRKWLVPMRPQLQRAVEHSGGGRARERRRSGGDRPLLNSVWR